MLNETLEQALNDQVNYELTAAHGYLALAAYFDDASLNGFASFMRNQFNEEIGHAMKLFDYIHDRGGKVKMQDISVASADYDTPQTAIHAALEMERKNTQAIHKLYKLALDADDYPTQSLLKWFIDEQVEEEKWANEILSLLKMVGDQPSGLLLLDSRVGSQHGVEATDAG